MPGLMGFLHHAFSYVNLMGVGSCILLALIGSLAIMVFTHDSKITDSEFFVLWFCLSVLITFSYIFWFVTILVVLGLYIVKYNHVCIPCITAMVFVFFFSLPGILVMKMAPIDSPHRQSYEYKLVEIRS